MLPWCRKSLKITEVLPLLYLHGLSSKDFIRALVHFPGSGAGLSAPAITRLTGAWQEEYRRWCARDLSSAGYVYCWAGGLHVGVRLDAGRVCTRWWPGCADGKADGKKELAAVADGHRESPGSWAGLLRDARRACVPWCSRLGTGAGFWAALREVFPGPDDGEVPAGHPGEIVPERPMAPPSSSITNRTGCDIPCLSAVRVSDRRANRAAGFPAVPGSSAGRPAGRRQAADGDQHATRG